MRALDSVLILVLLLGGCSKADLPDDTPSCIKSIIRKMEREDPRNPRGSVWQYTYRGTTVYFIPADCCDQYSELLDSDCNLLCAPDGGITGTGDGRCADFFSERKDEKVIWEDGRR